MAALMNRSSVLTPQSWGHNTWDWPDGDDDDEVQILAVKPRIVFEKPKSKQEHLNLRSPISILDVSHGSKKRPVQNASENVERPTRKRMKFSDRVNGMLVPKPSYDDDEKPAMIKSPVSMLAPRRTGQPIHGVLKGVERHFPSKSNEIENLLGPPIDLKRPDPSTKRPDSSSSAFSTNIKRTSTASNANRALPFLEDDSSDDEMVPAPLDISSQPVSRDHNDTSGSQVAPKSDAVTKEVQRQESNRLRLEALDRKNTMTPSNDGFKASQVAVRNADSIADSKISTRPNVAAKELQRQESSRLRQEAIERKSTHTRTGILDKAPLPQTSDWLQIKQTPSGKGALGEMTKVKTISNGASTESATLSNSSLDPIEAKKRIGPRLSSPFTFKPDAKSRKAMDEKPQYSEERMERRLLLEKVLPARSIYQNFQDLQETNARSFVTSQKQDIESVQPMSSLHGALSKPSSVSTHQASNPARPDSDAERLRQLRIQNYKKYSADLEAQIKVAAEAERQAEAERVENARKEEEAKQRVEAAAKRQAEVRKEAYRKAQREADEQRAAEARARELEKKEAQQRQYAEARKREEGWREAVRKRSEQLQREQTAISNRHAALAKIARANAQAKENAEVVREADKSGVRTEVQTQHSVKGDLSNFPIAKQEAQMTVGLDKAVAPSLAADRARKHVQAFQNNIAKSQQAGHDAGKNSNPTLEAREQRIQAKKERNTRMRQAEEECEDPKEEVHEALAKPAFKPLLKGPQSLNSLAGQSLLARAKMPAKVESQASTGTRSEGRLLTVPTGRKGRKSLGEILPEDIKLLKLREGGLSWPDITFAYERAYGLKRSSETLRLRHKQLKEVIGAAGADRKTINRASDGDEVARRHLNMMVRGGWPLERLDGRENGERLLPSLSSTSNARVSLPPPLPAARTTHDTHQSSPSYESSFESRNSTELTVPDLDPEDSIAMSRRPQYGGKTMNSTAYQHLLEGIFEMNVQEADEKQAMVAREPSPLTAYDYCHFGYQVERRELSREETEYGVEIDMKPWLVCCNSFDNLREADVQANELILLTPRGTAPVAVGEWQLKHSELEDGCECLTLEGSGVVQVRVTQFMRTYQECILPESKDRWAPKFVYLVKERTAKESVPAAEDDLDELFHETAKVTIERLIENTVYTILELANMSAVKEFVRMTFIPKSGHLRQRDLEIQAEEQRLMQYVEEEGDDGSMFDKEATGKNGAVVRIFVEKGRLAGPRNLD